MNIIREFFLSSMGGKIKKYLMFLLCFFSIAAPGPQVLILGLDTSKSYDNAVIVLGPSTGSQTQKRLLDLALL